MNKLELIEWLSPLNDEYKIKIFNGADEIDFNPLLDIDFNHKENLLIIDGRRNNENIRKS